MWTLLGGAAAVLLCAIIGRAWRGKPRTGLWIFLSLPVMFFVGSVGVFTETTPEFVKASAADGQVHAAAWNFTHAVAPSLILVPLALLIAALSQSRRAEIEGEERIRATARDRIATERREPTV